MLKAKIVDQPTPTNVLEALDTIRDYLISGDWVQAIVNIGGGVSFRLTDIHEDMLQQLKSEESQNCKACKYFNWKLSGTRHWGECQNERVQSAMRLSLKLVNLGKHDLDDVRTYTRIYFDEDVFGCIFHQVEIDDQSEEST